MSNSTGTAVKNTQIYNQSVLNGFVSVIAPLLSFSTDISPIATERGQTVNISFIPSGSTPAAWSESTGYVDSGTTREAKSVSLDQHYYLYSSLTDREIAESSLVRITDAGEILGKTLGLYVVKDVVGIISGSNFPNGVHINSSSLFSVDQIAAVRKVTSGLGWPTTKNIVLNVNAFNSLLKDDDLKYMYKGNSDVVDNGAVKNIFGFQNVFEATDYPTTLVSGSNKQIGFAAHPSAVLFASRYLVPGDGNKYTEAMPLTDAQTGCTIGYRSWYDENYGKQKTVYECLWGKSVGNSKAAVNLTATVDV